MSSHVTFVGGCRRAKERPESIHGATADESRGCYCGPLGKAVQIQVNLNPGCANTKQLPRRIRAKPQFQNPVVCFTLFGVGFVNGVSRLILASCWRLCFVLCAVISVGCSSGCGQ